MDFLANIFSDQWLWLTFVCFGLLLSLIDLVTGLASGLDLLFIGSAFIIGGLVTWPAQSMALTIIVTTIICVAYIFVGRRYVHR